MARKKHKSKYISFIIVSDNQPEPRNWRIRTAWVRTLLILGLTLLVLIAAGFASYWKVASKALENNRLTEENFKLRKSLNKLDQIKKELALVKGFEKQLKSSLNGYVTIEKNTVADSIDQTQFNFAKLNPEKRRSFFRNIPSIQPAEGFVARGFDASSLIREPHLGIDIAAPTGTPVKAPADGVVMFSGWTADGGNILILDHGFGFMTLYKHNERNLVKRLEQVRKGQTIALTGNTGKITSGPHLHYEIWKNGRPVDPAAYMNQGKKTKS